MVSRWRYCYGTADAVCVAPILALLALFCETATAGYAQPQRPLVEDEATARAIATAVFSEIVGGETSDRQQPYTVKKAGMTWEVTGNLGVDLEKRDAPIFLGGVLRAVIANDSGRFLYLSTQWRPPRQQWRLSAIPDISVSASNGAAELTTQGIVNARETAQAIAMSVISRFGTVDSLSIDERNDTWEIEAQLRANAPSRRRRMIQITISRIDACISLVGL